MIAEFENETARVPEIVHTVLTVAERLRRTGHLTQDEFDAKVLRLVKEELQPRGLELLIRELADGRTRFIIKVTATQRIRELVEFPQVQAAA